MDVVSAKTSFFEGITLSFCPCGYAQPPEGDKPSPLIELTPFPPLQRQRRWRGGKGYLSILLLSSLSRGLKPTVTRVASLRDAFLLLSLSIFARKFCVHPCSAAAIAIPLSPTKKTAQSLRRLKSTGVYYSCLGKVSPAGIRQLRQRPCKSACVGSRLPKPWSTERCRTDVRLVRSRNRCGTMSLFRALADSGS